MDSERHSFVAADFNLDRRIIRVDVPPPHAGITAALRRAFAPVATDPYGRDLDELLQKLN